MANPLPIKITELDPLDSVANNDIFITVDKSDTTHSSDGITKRVTAQIFKNYIFSDFTSGSVDNLSDVSITNQEGNQLLKYDALAQKWVNWTPNYLTSFTESDPIFTAHTSSSITDGTGFLKNDGSGNWTYDSSIDISGKSIYDLSNVVQPSGNLSGGEFLTWDGASESWVAQSVTISSTYTLPTATASVLGGVKIGSGVNVAQDGTISVTIPPAYSLPTASTTTLGGVKIDGTSITIDGNGVISSFGASPYTLPTASTTTLGGVKIDGTSITIDGNGVISSSGGAGLQSRTAASGTLSNLIDNNTASAGQLDIANVAKTYALLKIQTSAAAWVTLYTSDAARDADASRTETTDPLPGSGVIAEVITSGAETQIITPGTLGWNDDSTPSNIVYAKVINKSGSTANLTVTLTYVELES